MKKLPVFLLGLLLLAGSAQAQLNRRSNVSVGLKGGAVTSTFSDEVPYQRYLYGAQAGVFANLTSYSGILTLQPELLYTMRGSKTDPFIADSYTRLNYLDVPLALHLNASGFYFEVGPQVGFLLSAESKQNGDVADVKDAYRSREYSYLLGLGLQRSSGLGAGVRFNRGFNTATNAADGPTNTSFQLFLTYSIHRGRR